MEWDKKGNPDLFGLILGESAASQSKKSNESESASSHGESRWLLVLFGGFYSVLLESGHLVFDEQRSSFSAIGARLLRKQSNLFDQQTADPVYGLGMLPRRGN